MKTNFDVTKPTVVTEQDLKNLLTSLLGVQIPENWTNKSVVYDYICTQMRIVHEFFVEKLGNQDTLVPHVIQWMSSHKLLDIHSQDWIAIEQHMGHVVDLSESCLYSRSHFRNAKPVIPPSLSKRKASDPTFSCTGQSVGHRTGYRYLYTATSSAPDGISARDPFVILYGKVKMG